MPVIVHALCLFLLAHRVLFYLKINKLEIKTFQISSGRVRHLKTGDAFAITTKFRSLFCSASGDAKPCQHNTWSETATLKFNPGFPHSVVRKLRGKLASVQEVVCWGAGKSKYRPRSTNLSEFAACSYIFGAKVACKECVICDVSNVYVICTTRLFLHC